MGAPISNLLLGLRRWSTAQIGYWRTTCLISLKLFVLDSTQNTLIWWGRPRYITGSDRSRIGAVGPEQSRSIPPNYRIFPIGINGNFFCYIPPYRNLPFEVWQQSGNYRRCWCSGLTRNTLSLFWRGQFFFLRAKKKLGCFFVFWGCFCAFGKSPAFYQYRTRGKGL